MARRLPVRGITSRVTGDDKAVQRSLRHLQSKAVPLSRRRAINRAVAAAKTKGVRGTAKALDVPQRFIRYRYDKKMEAKEDRVRIFRATPSDPDAAIYLYTRGIPLVQLGAKDTKTKGVRLRHYKQWNNELENSFIAAKNGGDNFQVFTRVSGSRYPLKVEKIEDWYQHAHQHFAMAIRTVGPVFVKEFERQIKLRATRK